MKKMSALSVILFLCIAGFGQSNKEDIDLIQAAFGKEKKELIQSAMTIPETQKVAFWAEYDKYENERKALGRVRIKLIEDYANAYETIDDKKSSALMERKLKWLSDYTLLQRKYYGTVSKIIGGKQASKFFQIEDYIENNLRLAIQESIPFIEELDKTKTPSPEK